MRERPPGTTRGRITTTIAGGLAALFGILVLIGWHTQSDLLVRVHPSFEPMRYNSALCLLFSGLALTLYHRAVWLTRGLAVLAGFIAALVVMREVAGFSHAAEEWLLGTLPADEPGATDMPLQVAAGFVLVAVAILTLSYWPKLRRPSVWTGLLGTFVVSLGLVPFFGYLSGFESGYLIDGGADVAIHTASGLILLGVALLAEARAVAERESAAGPSPWLALSTGAGIIIISLLVFQALSQNEARQLEQSVRVEARTIRGELEAEIADELQSLRSLAARVEMRGRPPGEAWRAAAQIVTSRPRYLAVAWLDSRMRVQEAVPQQGNAAFVGADLATVPEQRAAAADAAEANAPRVSQAFRYNDQYGFFAYAPVFRGDRLAGYVAAAVDLGRLVEYVLGRELGQGYAVAISGPAGVLYSSHPLPADPAALHRVPLELDGARWQLAVWPLPWLRETSGTLLPQTVLVAGVLMALLLTYAMRAKQLLEHSTRRVREFNAALEQRVAQRTAELVAANQELAREIAERERVAKELAFLAKYDPLTGLANRVLFREHLAQALARAAREKLPVAVFFLDLDNFKDVNDTLGHHLGDQLLQLFSERLKGCLREADIIARLGGDEFVVLAEDLPHTEDCIAVAEKILEAMRPPFQLGENAVFASTSIGIATYPEAGADPEALIKYADAAMYQAKAEGRNTFAVYSTRLHQLAMHRLDLKRKLHEALDREEFLVYYQPKVHLASGRIAGAEALLRWRHDGRMVSPDDFIPLTEETGLIIPIGALVLRRTWQDLREWKRQGLPLPELSVNVSAKQFKDNRLLDDLYGCLEEAPELASMLELELTERVFIENSEAHRWLLKEVEAVGVRISIDDFGTGCSSFGYFRNFPIHTVKIDGSFIRHVTSDAHDAKITETVLDLAQNFRIKVIAEGVETAAQMEFLRDRRCDEAQGFYFSRPVPADQFLQLWQQQNGRAH